MRAIADMDLAQLGRSASQHAEYCAFLKHCQSEGWRSVSDFVRVVKLGFERESDAEGRLCACAFKGPPRVLLLPNDFPFAFLFRHENVWRIVSDKPLARSYHFVKGIHHFVLWKMGAELCDADFESAKATLRESHGAVEV